MGMSQNKFQSSIRVDPFLLIRPTLTLSCTVKSDSWSYNRLSDHTNADMCTDRKSRLSHDISCLFVHSFVHRILIIGRDARKLSFVRLHKYF